MSRAWNAVLLAGICPALLSAAPVNLAQVREAASTYVCASYPAHVPGTARTLNAAGASDLAVARVERLESSGATIGYVVHLEPAGYVLMRADDEVPPGWVRVALTGSPPLMRAR